jgi:NADPH-dependent curcumin reductase CurA
MGPFFQDIPALLAQGKLKSEEHLFWGMENGIAAFLSLFDGTAKAKPVVVIDTNYGA